VIDEVVVPERAPDVAARPLGSAPSPLVAVALVLLLTVPLVIGLGAVRHPKWYPVWDLALTEMQLRDVGTTHTPLTGVGGRIGAPGDVQGSHPGPLMFYLLTPAYRVLGSTAWAMQVAAVSVHVAALATALLIVRRRRSLTLLLGVAVVLAVLVRAFGAEWLTKAWNPVLPVLWWVVFFLAVWSVVSGDVPLLPVAVFAGSFCVQCHASYVVLATGLTVVAFAAVAIDAFRHRSNRARVRTDVKWSVIGLAAGVALWLPPVIDQLSPSGGNLGILWRQFRNWTEQPIGLRRGFDVLLLHLDPARLLSRDMFFDRFITGGSHVPGYLVLAVWATSVVVGVRYKVRALVQLDAVLAVTLVLAVVTISRLGNVYWYLLVWLWGLAAMLLFAIGWAAVVVLGVSSSWFRSRRAAGRAAGVVSLALAAATVTVIFALDATSTRYDRRDSAVLDRLVPRTVAATTRASSKPVRYLVVWDNATTGAVGRALMNELARHGIHVGAPAQFRAEVRPHRVLALQQADAMVVVAGGPAIQTWSAVPGARAVVSIPFTDAQQASLPRGTRTAVFIVAPPRYPGA
jgi:hypothetical protein